MSYNKLRIRVLLRVILLIICSIAVLLILLFTDFVITAVALCLFIPVQVVFLLKDVDTANEKIARLFHAISNADFTQGFYKGNEDKHLRHLNTSLNKVVGKFKEIRNKGEERELFLQTITHHISTGLLVVNELDEILLVNSAARKMLDLGFEKKLDDVIAPGSIFVEKLRQKKAETSFLIRIPHQSEIVQLSVSVSFCRIKDVQVRIIAIQDIGKELDKKELESWQLLTRVLAHEIMNSMTPIISLADSALKSISAVENSEVKNNNEVTQSVETIGRRAKRLIKFVDTYRDLTNVPKPNFTIIQLEKWLPSVLELLKKECSKSGIAICIDINPKGLELMADPILIEQVIINLILNSIYALKDCITDPTIEVSIYEDFRNRVCFDISDNGKGIPEELHEEIFVPFFTTRKEGSGIGLSLSRQIMHLHSGSIQINNRREGWTIFSLKF